MRKSILIFCVCVLAGWVTAGVTITVNGTACPYFAGQSVFENSGTSYFDIDRDDAETLPPFVEISGCSLISITAAGLWDHTPYYLTQGAGPDGKSDYYTVDSAYDDLGISLIQGAPVDLLLGVFLTDDPPTTSAPTSLVYGNDMTHPLLQQTFSIGSSLSNINVPTGATRLFFGLNNGWQWTNNSGSVDVTVTCVPAPGAILLAALGTGLVGWLRRRQSL